MAARRVRPKWTTAIACILAGYTNAETAALVEVSESTLYTWLRLPEFADLLQEERRRVMDRAGSRLQALTDQAIARLEFLLTCGERPTEARAALGILDRAARALNDQDFAARLDRLEQRAEADRRRKGRAG
jgi:hypothetical protein